MGMKIVGRERRKLRIRKKVNGTAERPRLTVFRSARHIYAQVINDTTGQTLAHASTLSKDLKGTLEEDNKVAAAKKVGALIAKICKTKKRFFRAWSLPFRMASGTSLALPRPTPTCPASSPTTTSAEKLKRRPPLTTFATRLMWITRSLSFSSST